MSDVIVSAADEVITVAAYQGTPGPPMPAVRLATASALPAFTADVSGITFNANGPVTLDGQATVAGTDVLSKNEGGGTSIYNRIFTVKTVGDSGTQERWLYKQNVAYKIGFPVVVGLGGINAGTFWQVAVDGAITPGTTPLAWQAPISGSGGGVSDGTTIQGNGSPGSPFAVKDGGIPDAKLTSAFLKADGSVTLAANWAVGSHKITGLADPTSAQDAATKAYVDAAAQGFDLKASVRFATTTNDTLSGLAARDGVTPVAGDRVLVKNQSAASQNGIYVAASGAWSRSTDADTSAEVTSGLFTFVSEGTINGGTSWALTTADPITLGSTALAFTQTHGPGTYTAGTGLQLTGTQFAIDSTVVTLAGSQALTNKTLTSPTINGSALSGTFSGNHTVSGQASFTEATAPIISAKIGPSSGQQHTIPTVTSSTLAVLGAAQTWTAVQTHSIDDGVQNDITDVVLVRHTYNAGNGASNIAAGMLFQTEDSAGNVQDTARIAGILTNATSGSETSAIDFWAWSSGALTRRMRLGSDGGLLVGSTAALGAIGIGIPNATFFYARNNTDTGWVQMFQLNGTRPEFGTNIGCMFRGQPLQLLSGTTIDFFPANQTGPSMSNTTMMWGCNDATASATDFTHRGANITGTNAAGKTLAIQAPLGTGTGTNGILRFTGGKVGSTGTTAHALTTLMDLQHSAVDNDTVMWLTIRKGGVDTTERVTLVAAASVAGSGRNFLSVS